MDVSTPPCLDLACPQAKVEIDNHDHMFRERGVDKNKIRTWKHHDHYYNSNIIHHKTSLEQVTIHDNIKV